MESLSIVVNLDVIEHVRNGTITRIESFAVDSFHFQAVIPALHRGIVVTITFCTHAANHAVFIEHIAMLLRTVLAAAIGMHDHTARPLAIKDGHA